MPTMMVITDSAGRVVASIRTDPVETEAGTIQLGLPGNGRPLPSALSGSATQQDRGPYRYQEVTLDEKVLQGSVEDLHAHLQQRLDHPKDATPP